MTNPERMTPPLLHDARALLDVASQPGKPDDPQDVAASLAGQRPGLRLTLLAYKHVQAYEAWLWRGSDGRAYYSKRLASGRTLAWAPSATLERVLRVAKRSKNWIWTKGDEND